MLCGCSAIKMAPTILLPSWRWWPPPDAAEAARALRLGDIWSRLVDSCSQRGGRQVQPTWLEAVSAALLGKEEAEALSLRLKERREAAAQARKEEREALSRWSMEQRGAAVRARREEKEALNLRFMEQFEAATRALEKEKGSSRLVEQRETAAWARREEADRVAAEQAERLEILQRRVEGSGLHVQIDSWGRVLYYETPGRWLSPKAVADYMREARRARGEAS